MYVMQKSRENVHSLNLMLFPILKRSHVIWPFISFWARCYITCKCFHIMKLAPFNYSMEVKHNLNYAALKSVVPASEVIWQKIHILHIKVFCFYKVKSWHVQRPFCDKDANFKAKESFWTNFLKSNQLHSLLDGLPEVFYFCDYPFLTYCSFTIRSPSSVLTQ